jgi:monoamine oxidase
MSEENMSEERKGKMDRRSLLKLIGTVGGSGVMYQAMDAMGMAARSDFAGPISLPGDPKGASVVVLGGGWGGMVAAHELGKAG